MKISKEARDLFRLLEPYAVSGRDYSPILDGECIEHIEEAMQSLINSTLDRAAGVADGNIMSGNDQWCAGHDAAARRIASAIRALII